MTQTCTLCKSVIPSGATVCKGCGAVKKITYDKSLAGKIWGYFSAVFVSILIGWFFSLFINDSGYILGAVICIILMLIVSKKGASVEYWDKS